MSVWIALASLAGVVLVNAVAVAFWAGRMSQRMTHVELGLADRTELNDKVTALVIHQENSARTLEKVSREMEGVHRQLANIATNRIGVGGELP